MAQGRHAVKLAEAVEAKEDIDLPPTADIYWFVPGQLLLALAILVSASLFGLRAYRLYRLLRVGRSDDRLSNPSERARSFLVYVLGQRRLFLEFPAGLMHALIFWGFIVLTLGTLDILARAFGGSLPLLEDNPLFLLLQDVFAVLVLGAVAFAAYRRYVARVPRLLPSRDAAIILVLIFSLMVTLLGAEGFRLVDEGETATAWRPISSALAAVFGAAGITNPAAGVLYRLLWWSHVLLILGFLVYLPSSKHLHIITAAFNVFFRELGPMARLSPIDIESAEAFGLSRVEELTWKGLLDLYTCTECGRCTANCPANLTGKPLSPMHVILHLKENLFHRSAELLALPKPAGEVPPLAGHVIETEALWACTTCGACQYQCPVFIEHIPKIIEMRRELVLMESSFPTTLRSFFNNLERNGNPWEFPRTARGEWAEGLGIQTVAEGDRVEFLYWVGCAGAFDPRMRKVAIALARVLQAAGISFGILGNEEKCTGEAARRVGNEYLFQMLAQENIQTLKRYNIKRIITLCPHCYYTLKHEYPQFGGSFEVIHHTELLADLVERGRLRPERSLEKAVAYHDSCYLGRYHDIYQQPRRILSAIPGLRLVEMGWSRGRSFCCGGGGGRSWMEENIGRRVNQTRVEHALAVSADTVASACPYCLAMLEDGVRGKGVEDRMQVVDVAELLALSLGL